ncbi:MAG: lipid-A-disaccharide synthase [Paludibacteraceae bacterium]|nr:lipid-A-disaccharide synthase [Paludibacteraceae bacterium]
MKYFIIAGEASGDLHASNLMRELIRRDSQAEFTFLGGDLMRQAAGQRGTLVHHYRDMAFMGFVNVLLNLRTVLRNLKDAKDALLQFQPDVLILIDYPSFNLRMAEFCKKKLKQTSVCYYISPKIWAWKQFRIHAIKKYVDHMLTILPFETEFYTRFDYQVNYVGNPSVDSVFLRPNQDESFTHFTQANGLSEKPIVALLAGSRRQEISSCLPAMAAMAKAFPDYQFVVAGAPGVDPAFYETVLKKCPGIKVLFDKTYDLLQQSHAAVVNSGTATLETALFRVPQVVVYQVLGGRLANVLKKWLIKVPYVALANLIAGREMAKELIAADFTERNLHDELKKILKGPERERQLAECERIIAKLGAPGTAAKAADAVMAIVEEENGER